MDGERVYQNFLPISGQNVEKIAFIYFKIKKNRYSGENEILQKRCYLSLKGIKQIL